MLESAPVATSSPTSSFPDIPEYELPLEPQTALGKKMVAAGLPVARALGVENCSRYFRWYTCGKHPFTRRVTCSSWLCYRCAERLRDETIDRHEAQFDAIARAPRRVAWFITALIPCAKTKAAINALGDKVVADLNSLSCEDHEHIAWAFLAGFKGDSMIVNMLYISADHTEYDDKMHWRFKHAFESRWTGCQVRQTSTKLIRQAIKNLLTSIIPEPKDRATYEIEFFHVRRMRYLQGNIKAIANIAGPNADGEEPEPELLRVTVSHPHGEGVHCPTCGGKAIKRTGLLPIEELESTRSSPPWRPC